MIFTEAQKDAARKMVQQAVKAGRLYRPGYCEGCSVQCKPEGHHDDYAKPLMVRWLCKACHTAVHHPFKIRNLFGLKRTRQLVEAEYNA